MATLSTQAMRPLPAPPTPRSARGSIAMAIFTSLFLAFPLIITAAVVPKFEEIFKDFGVALPTLTRMFIQIGRVLSSPLGWAVVLLLIGAAIVPASIFARRTRFGALFLFLAAVVIAFIYILLLVGSMFTPLVEMIESLQAAPKP